MTEQQTPPATSTKKSFEFTPTGPTIREVRTLAAVRCYGLTPPPLLPRRVSGFFALI